MDLTKTIQELRSRREQIDQAISSLERLAVIRPKKRGRPPKLLAGYSRRLIDSKPTLAAAGGPV